MRKAVWLLAGVALVVVGAGRSQDVPRVIPGKPPGLLPD